MGQRGLDDLARMVRLPLNSVKVFTELYLYRVDRLMVPLLVTLNQRGFGIRFAAWGPTFGQAVESIRRPGEAQRAEPTDRL